MNPFEPGEQNSERQPWWPDPASKPKETDAAPETDKTIPVPEPEESNITPDLSGADAAPDPSRPLPEDNNADPSCPLPEDNNTAPSRPLPEDSNTAPSHPLPEDHYVDPSRPLPGESYADFMHRLDRERKRAHESTDYGRQEYWAGLRDHGRGVSGDPNYGPIPEEFVSNGMSKAAFVFGIASLISIFFNGSLFFGSLGILFAFLSRKNKFSRQARIGLWMSVAGVTTFLLMLIISISILVSTGAWNKMMDIVRNQDPNQPVSVSEIQQELMDEVLAGYGTQRT